MLTRDDVGLLLTDDGLVCPSNITGLPDDKMMKEDMISNSLVRLSCRLCNFIATYKTQNTAVGGNFQGNSPGNGWSEASRTRDTSISRWQSLAHEFDVWFDGLPPTFKPSARIRPFKQPFAQGPRDKARMFSEIWFAIPMCASTMQHYHMARILMLLHKSNRSDTRQKIEVASADSETEDIVYHCYEIWYVD